MFASRFFALTLLLAIASGKPVARSSLQVHESIQKLPAGFKLKGSPSSEETLNLRIALAQNDPAGLIAKLLDVSNPSSANYGQWLSKEDTERFTAPLSESYAAVTSWLRGNGITAVNQTSTGQWLSFSLSVKQASELFDADFNVYTHEASNTDLIRTLSYSVPSDLQDHIDVVHPTTAFVAGVSSGLTVNKNPSSGKSKARDDVVPSACASTITPACLQILYGIPSEPANQSSNVLGVSGFTEEWVSNSDVQTFLENLRPDINPNATYTLIEIDGATNPQEWGVQGSEADLDVEYTLGLATNVPIEFIAVGTDNSDGIYGFLDQIQYLLAQETVPTVLSTSYAFDQDMISREMANTMCQAYAALTSRGTSLLFASGDGGVAGNHGETCTEFIDLFPSGCPFVTSVGATNGVSPEVAADFSGGGFSNYFPRPSYQDAPVDAFLAGLGDTYSGLYNASGRAYPDIAAQGVDFEISWLWYPVYASGTSCATPTVASIVALINDRLISAGRPVLGFLNPWIYANASGAFTDITAGSASGCNTDGWGAVDGWDPITGLGTPVFSKLLAAAGL